MCVPEIIINVPSRIQRALSDGILRFSIIIILVTDSSRFSKISVQCIENLSIPSDRARWKTLIVDIRRRIWNDFTRIWCCIFNKKTQCFGIFVALVGARENLIISFEETRQIMPGTLITISGTQYELTFIRLHLCQPKWIELRVAIEQTKDIVVVVSVLSHSSTRQPTWAATSFRNCLLVLQEPKGSFCVNVKKNTSYIFGLDSRNFRYDSLSERAKVELDEFHRMHYPCRLFFNSCVAVTRSDHYA